MNNFPRQVLRQIIEKHGKDVAGDARRCESLLNDWAGKYRREVNVLVNAVEERITLDLLAAKISMSPELILTRFEKRLAENTGMTDEAARWAVESWALALDVISEKQLSERVNKSQIPNPKSEIESAQSKVQVNLPPVSNPLPSQRPKVLPPIQPPQSAPPASRRTPQNFPPVAKPANPQTAPNPQVVIAEPPTVRKGLGFFRGCFITLFLLAVLGILGFVVAPYALKVMRQTQQERQNEPPRFPQ